MSLADSEYYDHLGCLGNNVPEMHDDVNYKLYRALTAANKQRLCASAYAVGFGGLGVALAKKSIASGLGMDITLERRIFVWISCFILKAKVVLL